MSNKKFRYKLTLEVETDGRLSFASEQELASELDLPKSLAFDIQRMLSIMDEPPNDADIVNAMNSGTLACDPLSFLARLYDSWTGENGLDECVRITVDIDALCLGDDRGRCESVRRLIARSPFAAEGTIEDQRKVPE